MSFVYSFTASATGGKGVNCIDLALNKTNMSESALKIGLLEWVLSFQEIKRNFS